MRKLSEVGFYLTRRVLILIPNLKRRVYILSKEEGGRHTILQKDIGRSFIFVLQM